ncbi:MAG: redox-regulated ATPase YchF [Spirochaetes bacterium GWD1_27_9]|nr:MAG: redox-regulated ATPase YchF [Spirochaetes bacterium GWC1_27_15]OHD41543.1 MAG: redox-regulated ATPase YchF [Spirochaetes bacterium GWD1_27_9]
MKLGIVGMPNVGKSTLFNALTKAGALAANYPFATINPNIGVVPVPDERLAVLSKLYESDKITPAYVEFVDIAGLVRGASKGEGKGNAFLSHIREVDAIVQVVRCFDDNDIIHVEGNVDPARDIETINLELILADIQTIEKRLEKAQKSAKASGDKKLKEESEILQNLLNHLSNEKPVRTFQCTVEQKEIINTFFLLTDKPIIYASNVAETDLGKDLSENKYIKIVREKATKENAEVVIISAKVEDEIAQLDEAEKAEFLQALGFKDSGLDRLIKASYKLLGLFSYLTAGKQEVRAWTIPYGTKAPQAAGKIHSDFEKGFIRAEIVNYNDLIKLGSTNAVKEQGRLRVEGKEYVMQEGDVVYFRFNV